MFDIIMISRAEKHLTKADRRPCAACFGEVFFIARGGISAVYTIPSFPTTCLCIDLKSYYASVECVSRGLDPLTANLLVADESRTDKTICLAVSPSLKALGGIPNRFPTTGIIRCYRIS